jgi:hypothetical protein
MGRSNVRDWFAAFERASREREQGRAELAWLGLVDCADEESREGTDCFDRNVVPAGEEAPEGDDCLDRDAAADRWRYYAAAKAAKLSPSKRVDPATRLGFLMGIVLIASVTSVFLCG